MPDSTASEGAPFPFPEALVELLLRKEGREEALVFVQKELVRWRWLEVGLTLSHEYICCVWGAGRATDRAM